VGSGRSQVEVEVAAMPDDTTTFTISANDLISKVFELESRVTEIENRVTEVEKLTKKLLDILERLVG
jgi:hypothetical protein